MLYASTLQNSCTGWSKSLCVPDDYNTKNTQKYTQRWPTQNTFRMWTVLYCTRSSRTQFSMSINVWRLVGGTLIITCNFLYCNHQVHRDFLITLDMRKGFYFPSISHAGQSFSILAWIFKFSKFSFSERNCIKWIWSKQKLICEEWIYLYAYKSVIMQLVSVFITSHPYTTFFCFSTPAFCLERLLCCSQNVPGNYDKVCIIAPTI